MSAPTDPGRLQGLRDAIDRIDAGIAERLVERMRLVKRVADEKRDDPALPLRDPVREAEVLRIVAERAREAGLPRDALVTVFAAIIDASNRVQKESLLDAPSPWRPSGELLVAYQGVPGAWSDVASRRIAAAHGAVAKATGFVTFDLVHEAVVSGAARIGVLPVENSTTGSIHETYDILAETPLVIVAEAKVVVDHAVLGLPGAALGRITRILSHPQALLQCSRFLRSHPAIRIESHDDTADAARLVAERRDPALGAIASEEAGRLYSLVPLVSSVADRPDNATRFVALGRAPLAPCTRVPSKTSVALTLADSEGALAAVLEALAAERINLTKIESRPLGIAPFRYRFFLDWEGRIEDPPVARALEAVEASALTFRFLGSYPAL